MDTKMERQGRVPESPSVFDENAMPSRILGRRNRIRKLLELARTEEAEPHARVITNVRDLYMFPGLSAWLIDILQRVLMCAADWLQALSQGLWVGYREFSRHRAAYRREAPYRPPLGMTEREVMKDLEEELALGRVRWRRA